MFVGVLSLLWERWLARAAGYSWDRVRNARSVRELVGTIVVVALTTAATAPADAAVVALLVTSPAHGTDPGTRSTPGTANP